MQMTRLRFVLGTVCVYGLAAHAAFSNPARTVALPSNIILDRDLESIVAMMIDRSPTFRAQLEYLGGIRRLQARIVLRGPRTPIGQTQCRADAVLKRYQYGRIEAVVRVSSAADAPELIAHELEHVREYVEGMNFRYHAARLNDVWEWRTGHYETTRAIQKGRRVAEEVKTITALE